jgi:anti-anti-sigma factor
VTEPYFTILREPVRPGPDGRTVTRMRLGGELDMDAHDELRDALLEVVGAADCTSVLVDLRDLRFIDAAGVGAILGGYRAAAAAGSELRLANAGGSVRRVFATLGMLALFDEPCQSE